MPPNEPKSDLTGDPGPGAERHLTEDPGPGAEKRLQRDPGPGAEKRVQGSEEARSVDWPPGPYVKGKGEEGGKSDLAGDRGHGGGP